MSSKPRRGLAVEEDDRKGQYRSNTKQLGGGMGIRRGRGKGGRGVGVSDRPWGGAISVDSLFERY